MGFRRLSARQIGREDKHGRRLRTSTIRIPRGVSPNTGIAVFQKAFFFEKKERHGMKGGLSMNDQSKELYQKKMEAKLDEWNARIDEMKAKAQQADAEARIEIMDQVEALRQNRDSFREKLDALKETGGDAWKDIQAGLDNAYSEMKTSLERAMGRFGSPD